MYEIYERISPDKPLTVDDQIELDHLQREKGRIKAVTVSGIEARLFLERGNTLQVGEILKTSCGKHLAIVGAEEALVTATCDDWETFSKACYHLGNRHVKLQIGEKWLRITPDHVLEEMLEMLGLSVSHEKAVFSPESGAYSHGTHAHSHSHDHDHDEGHSHSHSHGHTHGHSH